MIKAVIFTGTRRKEIPSRKMDIALVLSGLTRQDLWSSVDIYVGDAKGVDFSIRKGYSMNNNLRVFYADWDRLGNAAGNIRNQKMIAAALEEHDKDDIIVIGFPCEKSKGTFNCMRDANKVGIKSISVPI